MQTFSILNIICTYFHLFLSTYLFGQRTFQHRLNKVKRLLFAHVQRCATRQRRPKVRVREAPDPKPCQNASECIKVYHNVLEYVRMCQNVPQCVRQHEGVRICHGMSICVNQQ